MALAACGGKPPQPVPSVDLAEQPITSDAGAASTRIFAKDPPPFRLVRLDHTPTFPLTGPPSLEPHFRVASPWYLACDRRGRLDDDALLYVEAWCAYRKDPHFDLVRALMSLRATRTKGIGDAVRRDIANHLGDRFVADEALRLIGPDDEVETMLVAVYVDLDRFEDADIVIRSLADSGIGCDRELLLVRFAFDVDRLQRLPGIYGNSACANVARQLSCLVDEAKELVDQGGSCEQVSLDEDQRIATRAIAARLSWKHEESSPAHMLDIAHLATSALAVHDAEELALSALDSALWMTSCDPDIVAAVQVSASRLQTMDGTQERFDDRRKRLIEMTVDKCRNTH